MKFLRKKFLEDILNNNALKFIILLGVVSLLADMTYEGARSITGPYLAILGASAVVVGFVSDSVSYWVTCFVSSQDILLTVPGNTGPSPSADIL